MTALKLTALVVFGLFAIATAGQADETPTGSKVDAEINAETGATPAAVPAETTPAAAPDVKKTATKKTESKKATGAKKMDKNVTVTIETSLGNIDVELNTAKAPVSVENFLKYVDAKFYSGLIFHRVIKDFMIQGGGFDEKGHQKDTNKPIKNEAKNGLNNDKYTIAMARTPVVDSATAQFFINTKDNGFLNHSGEGDAYGYAVFGKVTSGQDVIDKINAVPTTTKEMPDMPVTAVVIKSIHRKK